MTYSFTNCKDIRRISNVVSQVRARREDLFQTTVDQMSYNLGISFRLKDVTLDFESGFNILVVFNNTVVDYSHRVSLPFCTAAAEVRMSIPICWRPMRCPSSVPNADGTVGQILVDKCF
jgi:hypothetical protein